MMEKLWRCGTVRFCELESGGEGRRGTGCKISVAADIVSYSSVKGTIIAVVEDSRVVEEPNDPASRSLHPPRKWLVPHNLLHSSETSQDIWLH